MLKTVTYKAEPSASESSTYALVPTVFEAGQFPTTLVLVSGVSPFPTPSEALRSESKLSPGVIVGIVAAAAALVLLVATALIARRRPRRWLPSKK